MSPDIFRPPHWPILANSVVRLIPATSNERPSIPYSEIAAIAFTGRDTAAGKSYEAWVKNIGKNAPRREEHFARARSAGVACLLFDLHRSHKPGS